MKNNVNVYIGVAAHAHQLKNLEFPKNYEFFVASCHKFSFLW